MKMENKKDIADEQRAVPEQELQFAHSPKYTLGVEIEFQTLDKATWDLTPMAPVLLANAPQLLRPRLSPEFIQSILEIQTGVCFSLVDVENDLMQTISLAEELAADNNCMLFSASLHPFARYRDQLLTTNERYERIMQELQLIGRRFISQGFQISYIMAVENIMKFIQPMVVRLGSELYIDNINRILLHGTGSDFLRRRYRKTGDLQKVVQSLQSEFWQ
jgi:gamma-glutamyl:cysteine ligase YbdK (ATP-grasp superfamily)